MCSPTGCWACECLRAPRTITEVCLGSALSDQRQQSSGQLRITPRISFVLIAADTSISERHSQCVRFAVCAHPLRVAALPLTAGPTYSS